MAHQPVPPHDLENALEFVRSGGRLAIPTAWRVTIIDAKTLRKFENADQWLLKESGDGYRIKRGKTSDYLLPGQLIYVDDDAC